MKTPRFTDTHRFGREVSYTGAEQTREPGYLKKRFEEIRVAQLAKEATETQQPRVALWRRWPTG